MEPGSPESREAQLREHALTLARELSETNWREVFQRKNKNLCSEVNPKMKELMEAIAELEGQTAEKMVGDNGVVRFRAGSASKAWGEAGRLHSLQFSTRDEEGREQARVVAFIDSRDGGSLLMGRDLHDGNDPEWTQDAESQKDKEAYVQLVGRLENFTSDDWALLNRFRELRLAARMAQLVLGVKEQEVNPPQAVGGEVAGVGETVRKDTGGIVEK